jgi:hypothetical protein
VKYITYGIAGRGVMCSDVSVDRVRVQEIIRRLNDAQPEKCHFMDIIEDELVRNTGAEKQKQPLYED